MAILFLAACDTAPPATPTLTQPPTLAATAVFNPVVPTGDPEQASVFAGQNDPTAAAFPRDSELPPLPVTSDAPGVAFQSVQVTAADGGLLAADLYPATGDAGAQEGAAPGVLLLSPAGGRGVWLDLPLRLQADGFTVLSAEPRNANDFTPLLTALGEVSNVNPGSLVAIGAESAAGIALSGCAADPECDAVALFSPASGFETVASLNPRPLFLAYAADEADTLASLRGNATTVADFPVEAADNTRGAALLQIRPALRDDLRDWLQTWATGDRWGLGVRG